MLKAEHNLKATGEAEPFPHSVLEKIASRFRPAFKPKMAGLYVCGLTGVAMAGDGSRWLPVPGARRARGGKNRPLSTEARRAKVDGTAMNGTSR